MHVATYALSSTALPVVRRAKVPVIVLNLSPVAQIDYSAFNALGERTLMTGEWLTYCQSCSIPEIANVFNRSHIKFQQVTGLLSQDDSAWLEIREWIAASRAAFVMEHNRLGVMGHYYSGMLDVDSDLTLQTIVFGTTIEIIEVDELTSLRRDVTLLEITEKTQQIYGVFDVQPDCLLNEIESSARTSVALDKLAQRYQLGSLAYYYKGSGGSDNQESLNSIIVGASLLTGRGIPVAGELEIKNVQAMKIFEALEAGGSFSEYYAVDFIDDVILLGHDGPGHVAMADGRPKIRQLNKFHGKVGAGLSIEMSVKAGDVTLLSVAEDGRGGLRLVVAEGRTESGPILQIGNTNSRYRFRLGARGFLEEWNRQGAAHHCAIGVGHHASVIKKLSLILDIDCVQVC